MEKIYNHFNIYLTKSTSFYFLVNTPPSQLKRKTRIVGGEKRNNSEIYCQGLDSIDARTLLSQQSFVTPSLRPSIALSCTEAVGKKKHEQK